MQVLVGDNYGSYTFNAAAQTVTLNNLPSPFVQTQLKLIVNANTNTLIFNLIDPTMTATVSGNVITLAFNTSSMNNSDPLQIFLEVPGIYVSDAQTTQVQQLAVIAGLTNDITPQYQELPLSAGGNTVIVSGNVSSIVTGNVGIITSDNTILDSKTISNIGAGNVYVTTGYQTLSFQFSGNWTGSAQIYGSNDNLNWFSLLAQNATDGSKADLISTPGIYTVSVNTNYVYYNFAELIGRVSLTVLGKTSPQDETALIAQSFDSTTGIAQNTNIVGGLNRDSTNSLILSDAPAPIYLKGVVGTTIILDTQGYQAVQIASETMAAGVTYSNDQITWSNATGVGLASPGTFVAAISTASNIIFGCAARYIRFVFTTAGTGVCYFRNFNSLPVTLTGINSIGGSTILQGGLTGLLAVGGSASAGSAMGATYPIVTAGVDTSGVIRRLFTDSTGKLIGASTDQTNTSRPVTSISPPATFQNAPALLTQDTTQFEGQSIVELLAQILVEMKIANYYLFNLPALLNAGSINNISDEPGVFRNTNNQNTQPFE